MFRAWGRIVYRLRWATLLVSVLLLGLAVAIVLLLPAPASRADGGGVTESGRAQSLIAAQLPQQPDSFVLIFGSNSLEARDPSFQAAVEAALAPIVGDSRVSAVNTPYNTSGGKSAALISTDGHEVIALVTLATAGPDSQRDYKALRREVHSSVLQVTGTGGVAIDDDLTSYLSGDLTRTSGLVFGIALLLLVLIFGSVVAAGIPLLIAVAAEVTGIALGVNVLGRFTDVSQYATDLIALIGLGVAIDYSLVIVSRFREELNRGKGVEEAVVVTLATAGRAIMFSGITVAIGLLGLLFYQGSFVASMGAAGAIAVLAAVAWGLVLLPALLAVLGERVNLARIPRIKTTPASGRGAFHAITQGFMRHPRLVLVPVACGLVLAATPILDLQLRTTGIEGLPPQAESRVGMDKVQTDFPTQSVNSVLVVVDFEAGDPVSAANASYVDGLEQTLAVEPDVTGVERSQGSHIALLTVDIHRPADSPTAKSFVETIRAVAPPHGGHLMVTGATASNMDDIAYMISRTPAAVAFVMVATYLLLLLLLRSIVLPLKAVLTNLMSISAAFGAVVLIFQCGGLGGVLNFTPQPVDPFILALLFAVIFGLSMDYEVFMLSRIQEHYRSSHDTTAAVAAGLATAGRLITGAAAIMLAVFLTFGLIADTIVIKEIGIGLAIAVALDATVVRIALVPAAMQLLGKLNWWAPRRRTAEPQAEELDAA